MISFFFTMETGSHHRVSPHLLIMSDCGVTALSYQTGDLSFFLLILCVWVFACMSVGACGALKKGSDLERGLQTIVNWHVGAES